MNWTNESFAAFILTHGRPDKVYTFKTLREKGYGGPIYIIIDNEDKTKDKYIENFGVENVIIFDKLAISKTFDEADNFNDRRAIIYARNACFEIAKNLGLKYFVQLDDDYKSFDFRFNSKLEYTHEKLNFVLDSVFYSILQFFINTTISSISLAQGGDYIGGAGSGICFGKGKVGLRRKCMNSFFCSVDRPFKFNGRINEDVNTYTQQASIGLLLFTENQVALEQLQTQQNSGGMTELYLESGTYIKSFYSIIFQPSSVVIKLMGFTSKRLHHSVNWDCTVPKILSSEMKKLSGK